MGAIVAYYCVKFLHRHPSEVDLTLDQIYEVAFIGQDLEKQEAEMAKAMRGIL